AIHMVGANDTRGANLHQDNILDLRPNTFDIQLSFFAHDVTSNNRAKTFSVYFSNQTGRVYYYGGKRGHLISGRQRIRLNEQSARCRILVDGQQLKFLINDELAMAAPLSRTEKLGRGLVFRMDYIRSLRKTTPTQLTISDFRVAGSAILDDQTLDLALTVPRSKRDKPPSHLLVAHNGDLLRGRLLSIEDGRVRFESKLRPLSIPRSRVAAVVAVAAQAPAESSEGQAKTDPPEGEPDGPEPAKAEAPVVHALLNSGGALKLTPTEMTAKALIGRSAVLGDASLRLEAIRELRMGNTIGRIDEKIPFYEWNLKPIKEPQFEDGPGGPGAGPEEGLVGQVVESMPLRHLDGTESDLTDLRGKVVVLDFWATWCVHCARSLPKYLALMKQYDKGQARLIGVNQGEGRELIEAYLKRKGWDLNVVLDEQSAIGEKFGVRGLPHLVVIGPEGKVRWMQSGYADGEEKKLEALIDRLLKTEKPKKDDPQTQPIF
ncbi:MAG: TlpA disulfide reductase family protein, partial [Phycisphaeraceae bacterium]|nr:TlpA disulfide reductase family protein [Phycisphaeraceae bacterium]